MSAVLPPIRAEFERTLQPLDDGPGAERPRSRWQRWWQHAWLRKVLG